MLRYVVQPSSLVTVVFAGGRYGVDVAAVAQMDVGRPQVRYREHRSSRV